MGLCLVYTNIKSIVYSLERRPVPLPTVYRALQITRPCMYRVFVYDIFSSIGTLTRVAGAVIEVVYTSEIIYRSWDTLANSGAVLTSEVQSLHRHGVG